MKQRNLLLSIVLIIIIVLFLINRKDTSIVDNNKDAIAKGILRRMQYSDKYDISQLKVQKTVVLNGVTIVLFELPDNTFWLAEMFPKSKHKIIIGGISSINNTISYEKVDSDSTSYLIVYGKNIENIYKIEVVHNERKYTFDIEDNDQELYFDYIDIDKSSVDINPGDFRVLP